MYRVLCLQCAVLIDGVYCTLHSVHSVVLAGGEEEGEVCNALVYYTMCTIQYFQCTVNCLQSFVLTGGGEMENSRILQCAMCAVL